MKKEFQMRRLCFLCFFVLPLISNAQTKADPVIMTVAGKDVPLAEFEYMASKNKEVDLTDKKSLDAYVELFKNFKLKVAEAEDLGFDKTAAFTNEFAKYKAELTASYMSDAGGQDAVVKEIYDRGNNVLELSYILFRIDDQFVSKDTVGIYNNAYNAYKRIKDGEDFDAVAKSLTMEDAGAGKVFSEYVHSLLPLKAVKKFDNVAFNMREGDVSAPVLTSSGYYLIKLHKRKPNSGLVKVAHILFKTEKDNPEQEKEALAQAEEIRNRALAGEDFTELAKEYSQDAGSKDRGGVISFFTQGSMVGEFEDAAFALKDTGAISGLVKSPYGFHIIKLLDKQKRPSFEEEKDNIAYYLKRGEWNFEYFDTFDSRLMKEYNYQFYPEAYAKLQAVCDNYFPTDSMYFKSVETYEDTLLVVNDLALTQKNFSYYLLKNPLSIKKYSVDFLKEVYDLYVRDIVTTFERQNLETKYPEYNLLLQEYRDGILLFEISNARVWEHPMEEQANLEKAWLEELHKKYPVTVNAKLLKKIKKH